MQLHANRQLIDAGWRFKHDAPAESVGNQTDDSGWRLLDLPHDWSVEFPFDSIAPSGNDGGYVVTGTGVYRKNINLKPAPDRIYYLNFEGVYERPQIWVNGHMAGGCRYGYTSFRVDITPWIVDGDNLIAVYVDNSLQKNSRWFTGSGIYRHVWLEELPVMHIRPGSLVVTNSKLEGSSRELSVDFDLTGCDEKSEINLQVSITGRDWRDTFACKPRVDPDGHVMISRSINNAVLWSLEDPHRYSLTLTVGGDTLAEERFGIRDIEFSTEGFRLNGKSILLNGACVHHDNGILGAASHDEAEFLKVTWLKEAGFNAVRTSHNPPAPAFLYACDSLGIVVIDEAFDDWCEAKTRHSYAHEFDSLSVIDLSTLVERDRNHPSVIAWSIGNEILERKSVRAVEIAHRLAAVCRALDPTRPVTQALASWDSDWEIYDSLAAEHDVVGYNYMIHKAPEDHRRVPRRIIWQTESYPRDAFKNWEMARDNEYVIGDFVWTGIDYLGESGIGRHYYDGDPAGEHWERPLWPWHASQCGDIDITGQRKPISYYRQMLYADSAMLSLAVREPDGYIGRIREILWGTWPTGFSWNFPGHEGRPITVEVSSTYPVVELYLNDVLVGRKAIDHTTSYQALFEIDYCPGTLRADARDSGGHVVDSAILMSPLEPIDINVDVQMPSSRRQYVVAEVVDENGTVVDTSNNDLEFEVSDGARIISAGNGNPKDSNAYSTSRCSLFRGRAAAWVDLGANDEVDLIIRSHQGDLSKIVKLTR